MTDIIQPNRLAEPVAEESGEFETFRDDERLAWEHAEYFYEEYFEDAGYLP